MNTHFCLIWLFKLERQGRIIRKIQISLESIPNLPRIQKIRAHRWTHRSFAFYLANGNPTLIRITWKRKDPGVSDVDSACHTLLQEARQKSVTKGWDCFPTLCWLNFFFFFFWFAFYSKVMIIWTFFFFSSSKLDQEQIGPDGSGCVVEDSASHVMCLWAQSETGGVPAHATVLCLHCGGWLVSSVMRAIRGLCCLV